MNWMNKNFRMILFVCLGCFLILLLPKLIYSDGDEEEEFYSPEREFAKKSLENYVRIVLDEKNCVDFGFKSLDDAKRAYLGSSYRVMFIGLRDLKAYKSGAGAKSLLKDAKTLWYPVKVKNETRTELEIIEKGDGKWIAGDFGRITNIPQITMAQAQLLKLIREKRIRPPYKIMLVKIPALQALLFYIESTTGEFMVPAMVQPQRYKLQNSKIYTADEILSILKEYAQEIEENKIG